MLAFRIIISAIVAYLIGNISNALILSRLFFGQDVRNYGSNSAGATNMFRTYGARFGVATLLLDILKGVIATALGLWFGGAEYGDVCLAVAGAAVIIGHDWPIFFKFKGGKGAATSIGVMMIVNPWVAIVCLLIAVLIAALTRYMSVGSLVAIFLGCLYAIIFKPLPIKLLFVLVFILDFWQHRANIVRLLKGEENPTISKSLIDKIKGKKDNNIKSKRNLK